MIRATDVLSKSLADWAAAIEAGDMTRARRIAEQLKMRGELLAIHPDFHACLKDDGGDGDAMAALRTVVHFLTCATECRKRALARSGARPAPPAAPG